MFTLKYPFNTIVCFLIGTTTIIFLVMNDVTFIAVYVYDAHYMQHPPVYKRWVTVVKWGVPCLQMDYPLCKRGSPHLQTVRVVHMGSYIYMSFSHWAKIVLPIDQPNIRLFLGVITDKLNHVITWY